MQKEAKKKASPTELRIYDDGKSKLMYAPVWMLLLNQVTKPNSGTPDNATPPISQTRAVELANSLGLLRETLTVDRVRAALRRYGDLPWFEDWLVLGDDPPNDVHVLSREHVERIDSALDHIAQLANAKQAQSYIRWFRRNVWRASSLDQWYERVLWTFSGIAPGDIYVVPQNITQLRLAESECGRAIRAKCSKCSVMRWRRSEIDKKALALAIECSKNGRPLSWLERQQGWIAAVGDQLWKDLTGLKRGRAKAATTKKKEAMLRLAGTYHRPTTLAALSPPLTPRQLDEEKQSCRDTLHLTADQGDALEDYITGKLPKRPNHMARGMLRSGMFVPPPLMWDFQAVASKAWNQNGMDEVAKTRGFKYLFLDRVLPRRLGPKKCPARQKLEAAVTIYTGGTKGKTVRRRNWKRDREPLRAIAVRREQMRRDYANGETNTAVLADRYNVSRGVVRKDTRDLRPNRTSRGRKPNADVAEVHRSIAAAWCDGDRDVTSLAQRFSVSKNVVWSATKTVRSLSRTDQTSDAAAIVGQPTRAPSSSTPKSDTPHKQTPTRAPRAKLRGPNNTEQARLTTTQIIEFYLDHSRMEPKEIGRRLGLPSRKVRATLANFRAGRTGTPAQKTKLRKLGAHN